MTSSDADNRLPHAQLGHCLLSTLLQNMMPEDVYRYVTKTRATIRVKVEVQLNAYKSSINSRRDPAEVIHP